ncbi:GNAT family N-acetyltransferase [Promicromonospora citrea]|uniref:N-acetyltransferase domain-containing protein n=1 Tax=Promicromonospora citrea TaxID=43677 RepID=A0A8H9GEI0_9MICO|nr:GNAT family N-acetyltransferase [Promicromonospora citrea]GGM15919.1 hypothetical protein GCM10010102_09400 [Promicromonospora citrea]HEV6952035.1 GNAT family N-acetyltransferase [Promicromonospora sp.]
MPTLLATRRAVPGDAPAIAPLLGQLGYPSTPDQVAARFARIAGRGDDAVWVAEDETGTVVGLATGHVHRPLERDLPLAQLTALVVDASRRGTGAGRALVAVFEEWARAAGCDRVTVSSAFRRTGAHAFYERLGYGQRSKKFDKTLDGEPPQDS